MPFCSSLCKMLLTSFDVHLKPLWRGISFYTITHLYNNVNTNNYKHESYTNNMKTKLLIFGITGDLSKRKLLPALDKIIRTGDFDDLDIIGVSRGDVDATRLLDTAVGSGSVIKNLSVFTMDVAKREDYKRLLSFIDLKSTEQLLIYLSVPPMAATQIVDSAGRAGMNTPNVKLLFEKPFGVDLYSAQEVISKTANYYDESQIYRIDHYLAKEMAQNIVAFRGGNALFNHMWDSRSIEKIELRATENIGIEGRAGFYEQTGALRDVLQGHLMQILALILMDIPDEFDWNTLPELRLAALGAVASANPANTIRAQYDTYQQEVKNIGSLVETFVSVGLMSRSYRWKNVPITLITGKALNRKTTEVRVYFRKNHESQSNCLTFHIQPNEGVEIELYTKKPGYDREFESQKLAFSYSDDAKLPEAYEQVIVDAIRSQKSLFTSSDEVLQSWRILQPILDNWAMDSEPIRKYLKGSNVEEVVNK